MHASVCTYYIQYTSCYTATPTTLQHLGSFLRLMPKLVLQTALIIHSIETDMGVDDCRPSLTRHDRKTSTSWRLLGPHSIMKIWHKLPRLVNKQAHHLQKRCPAWEVVEHDAFRFGRLMRLVKPDPFILSFRPTSHRALLQFWMTNSSVSTVLV
jgi:hypothetical protein